MKRNRLSTMFAMGLAILGATGLLACAVAVDPESATPSALIDRLPSGATAIGWIDVQRLSESMPPEEWLEYQAMVEDQDNWEDIGRFAEMTGFDPRTDLRQLAVVTLPGEEDVEPVFLISATFDRAQLESFLGDAETSSYEGLTIYKVDEDTFEDLEAEITGDVEVEADPDEPGVVSGGGDVEVAVEDPTFVAILDDTTVVIGDEGSVHLAIDVDAGRHDSLKMDPAMNDLISDVAGEGQIWFVAMRETWDNDLADLPEAGMPVPVSTIESIETMTLSVRLGDGLTMRLVGITGADEDARTLADALSGLTAMGKMMLQQSQPELFDIIDRGISVGSEGTNVHIQADLTDADLEVLRRLGEEMGQEQGVSGQ